MNEPRLLLMSERLPRDDAAEASERTEARTGIRPPAGTREPAGEVSLAPWQYPQACRLGRQTSAPLGARRS
jgi:hypothetical protein